ncbi:MAG TPA: hypothetical protein VLP43_07655 [Solirubrobacteraceae bacterium]|nr:hypothetical protein [Solirubrobacteraceae bacterium]
MIDSAALGARPGWRASPVLLSRLLAGLALFGAGEGLLIGSRLGNSPWSVLGQGVARHTPLSVGVATIAISFVVLLAWIPLGQRPGLGTVLNAALIGVFLDLVLGALPSRMAPGVRAGLVILGIACVAAGSGLYLRTGLGPGPRDGLMAGLHRLTGRPVRAVRAGIELAVVGLGFALGGTVGVGTVAFALTIGLAVQLALGVGRRPTMSGHGRRDRIRPR